MAGQSGKHNGRDTGTDIGRQTLTTPPVPSIGLHLGSPMDSRSASENKARYCALRWLRNVEGARREAKQGQARKASTRVRVGG